MYSEDIQRKCREALVELRDSCPGLKTACLATADGIAITSLHNDEADQRIAVMAGTVRAIADGLSLEAEIDACRHLVIDAKGGKLAVLSVPPPGEELVLAATGTLDINLGLLMIFGQDCAGQIASVLEADSELAIPGGARAKR